MSKSIIQIRQELEQASKEQRKSLLDAYQSDPRKGVQNLIEKGTCFAKRNATFRTNAFL